MDDINDTRNGLLISTDRLKMVDLRLLLFPSKAILKPQVSHRLPTLLWLSMIFPTSHPIERAQPVALRCTISSIYLSDLHARSPQLWCAATRHQRMTTCCHCRSRLWRGSSQRLELKILYQICPWDAYYGDDDDSGPSHVDAQMGDQTTRSRNKTSNIPPKERRFAQDNQRTCQPEENENLE